jgi:hypothetical protein
VTERRTGIWFACLPLRAIADPRLSALHFRVLACIAWHDRLSRKRKHGTGSGCVARHETLAQEVGCDYTRLSATITDLVHWGFLERDSNPLNRRLRTYHVLYTHEDRLRTGKPSTPSTVCEPGNNGATVCEPANNDPTIVCQNDPQQFANRSSHVSENQDKSALNIFCEAEDIKTRAHARAEEGRNCAEAHRATGGAGDLDAQLTEAEQAWQRARSTGNPINRDDVTRWRDRISHICDERDSADPVTQRARRLADELQAYLDKAA